MAEQWDFEKNTNDIDMTSATSKDISHWKCKTCGYQWSASAYARYRSNGKCPCHELNRVVVKGINDLFTIHPEAIESYDFDKNTDIDVYALSAGVSKDVWWKCKKCGYEWSAKVSYRSSSGFKCPCCDTNKVIRKGINDIFTLVPDMMAEYAFEKNRDIDIYKQGVDSSEKVCWKCNECNREWSTSIRARVKKVAGKYIFSKCPHYNTVKRKYIELVSEIPALMKFWDTNKNTLEPSKSKSNSADTAFWKCSSCGHEWSSTIRSRMRSSDQCPCCALNLVVKSGVNDLFTLLPEAKDYYNFERNKNIDITNLGVGSNKPVWWHCPDCGYEWNSSISSRIEHNNGTYHLKKCQQCYFHDTSRIAPVSSVPKLIRFWDFKKNKNMDVNLISAYSSDTAWWHCKKCNYEWSTTIKARISSSEGCPCCDSGRAIQTGFNDALTIVPELASIYDFDNNKHLDIFSVGVTSSQRANFKCKNCGNKWESAIGKRVRKGDDGKYHLVGCPICDNGLLRKMTYAEEYPDLIPLFDSNRNERTLDSVKSKETLSVKFWWICNSCGESFESYVQTMITALNTETKGCPYCSRTKLRKGESFADIHPELMVEYASDNEIDAFNVFPNAKKSVKWICRNNPEHTWEATFAQRHADGGNCPICNRTKLIPEINSFAAVYPEHVPLWAPSNERTPDNVFYNSSLWFHWVCPTCHGEYSAYIKDVLSNDVICPFCTNRRLLPGYNSFAAIHPNLMNEWDYTNNYLLIDPDQINDVCTKAVWWYCSKAHHYTMSPQRKLLFQKRNREPCPYCKGLRQKRRHFV